MTKRLQGGTAGILAALESGRLDPLERQPVEEHRLAAYVTPTELRKLKKAQRSRAAARAKRFATRPIRG